MSGSDKTAAAWRPIATMVLLALGVLVMPVPAAATEEFGEPVTLRSLDSEIDARYGTSVAIDGDTLAVGVPSSPEGGVVYVYERAPNRLEGWRLAAILNGRDATQTREFGASVALEDETLVVGAPWGDGDYQWGSAHVFYRNWGGTSNWGQARVLKPSTGMWDHQMGRSVAVSGDLVAIGAPGAKIVYVHQRHKGGRNRFGLQAELTGRLGPASPYDTAPGFGYRVALSGDTLSVGAFNLGYNLTDSYGVFLFDRVQEPEEGEPLWRQVLNYGKPGPGAEGEFATLLSLDGPLLLVGAPEPETGCWMYERNYLGKNRWGLRTEMEDATADVHWVGGLAVRGRTAAVAAQYRSFEEMSVGEGVLVYQRHVPFRNAWSVIARLMHGDAEGRARAIAVGPREVVTGHPDPGLVQIFPRRPLVAADFDAGDTAGLSWATGNVAVASPGLGGTEYCLAVSVDGTGQRSMVRARQPHRETRLSLRFNLALDRVKLGGKQVEIMNLYGPARDLVRLVLEPDPAHDQYFVRLWAWEQGDTWRFVGKARMPPKRSVRMHIEWHAATGPDHDNGRVRLYTDGRLKASAGDLDTDLQFVNGLLLGLPKGSQGTVGGAFRIDEIELHR